MTPDGLAQLGLGLEYGVVGHAVTRAEWLPAAQELVDDIRRRLGGAADAIEHIGSTAIVGLLAKPIVDIAIRLVPGCRPARRDRRAGGRRLRLSRRRTW